jgi:hypothetical protein
MEPPNEIKNDQRPSNYFLYLFLGIMVLAGILIAIVLLR